jgi:hypothetical protein
VGKQIVMDATGDTEHKFNPADAVALADAEKRFTEPARAGFNRAGNGGATPRPRHRYRNEVLTRLRLRPTRCMGACRIY